MIGENDSPINGLYTKKSLKKKNKSEKNQMQRARPWLPVAVDSASYLLWTGQVNNWKTKRSISF